jgi:hypothetical protein
MTAGLTLLLGLSLLAGLLAFIAFCFIARAALAASDKTDRRYRQ